MIRIVIAAGRNPTMTRSEFFRHLRHTHWPLVRDSRQILRYLLHYQQNHVIGVHDNLDIMLPFPHFDTRDSVIELGFESMVAVGKMTALPEYRDVIRPDEACFNDLPSIIATPCNRRVLFDDGGNGGVTRFDFLRCAPNLPFADFVVALDEAGDSLAIDPLYRGLVLARAHNVAIGREESREADAGGWVAQDGFDAIVSTRVSHVDALNQVERLFPHQWHDAVDAGSSRSLLAVGFLMHG